MFCLEAADFPTRQFRPVSSLLPPAPPNRPKSRRAFYSYSALKAKAPKQSARAEIPVYPTITNGSGQRTPTNGQLGQADSLSACVALCYDVLSAWLAQTRAHIKTNA
jgi:hypothetical protein